MKQIFFETSPAFIIVCLLVGVGYGLLLYKTKYRWSRLVNMTLMAARSLVAFLLCFLLMEPIIKQINNVFEKPLFIIINDDSKSIREATDSISLKTLEEKLQLASYALSDKGYEVKLTNLNGQDVSAIQYTATSSDLNSALKKVAARYEGFNVAGVMLLSDGIYNNGVSPLHATYKFPVYTVGVGDTTTRIDLSVKNIAYNKIAYQGNKFPVRVEVLAQGITNENITVSLSHHGQLLEKQTKNSGREEIITYDFLVQANDQGIQKLDVQVDVRPEEYNKKNNHASSFVEVVAGKKKILVVAPSPHPDIKAFRDVIDKNSNYEFVLHIPSVHEQAASMLKPTDIDLVIFLQAPDIRAKTRDLFRAFANSKTSMLVQLGQQSDMALLNSIKLPVTFTSLPRDYDDVTPAINSDFSNFIISEESNSIVADYPPVSVPFGKFQVIPTASSILYQRVGSLTTDKPLLVIDAQDNRKVGLLLGEGIWRWRLSEFDKNENTLAFDELFGKLIQYLSTTEDKRKFRSYPIKQEFADDAPVIFETQVYNDIFEPVYGNKIDIDVTDEHGKKTPYSYATSKGNTRYQIGGLNEGVYKYQAKTSIAGKVEIVKGEFLVAERQTELQNLTADFNLLRKLSLNTGGKFYQAQQIDELTQYLQTTEARSIIHSEENYNALINLKWIFFVLLALISLEWFVRKYQGSY